MNGSNPSDTPPRSALAELHTVVRIKALLATLPGIAEVERLVSSKFNSAVPLLQAIPSYLFELGGKRMRPLLTLMSARACGMQVPSQAVLDVAAGIELIHMATLLHDDIIDRSPLRRHKTSPYAKYGLASTLLSGDFLLTRAFSLCARLDRFIIDATEIACIELTEGEIAETPLTHELHTIQSSLEIARKKTASLFRLAATSAAHLADGDALVVNAMAEFGEKLGVGFQILDDILDVTSSEDLLGKKSGIDLRERKPSAINVLWLAHSPKSAAFLTTAPLDDSAEQPRLDRALAELRSSPVIAEARALARRYTDEALRALAQAERATLAKHSGATSTEFAANFEDLRLLVRFTLERLQ